MNRLRIILLLLIPVATCFSQVDTAYVRTYGGPSVDIGRSVQQTHDGGFIIAGSTSSFSRGENSIYLVKTDTNGIHRWSASYGGVNISQANSVKETLDKGFILCGYTNSYGHGGYDAYLVKTDSMGVMQWQQTYGGSDWDFGYSVTQLKDSGYVFCGRTYSFTNGGSDAYIVRTDKHGDTLWTKHMGGAGDDAAYAVTAFRDTNYVIGGEITSIGGDLDGLFLRYGSHGNLIHSDSYGGSGNDYFRGEVLANDNGFVFTGSSNSPGYFGGYDAYFVKTDSMGRFQWENRQGGYSDDYGYGIVQTPAGDLIFSGSTSSYGLGGDDLYTVRMIFGGGWLIHGYTFGGTGMDEGYALCLTAKGGVVWVGSTTSFGQGLEDVFLVKMLNAETSNSSYAISTFYADNLSPTAVVEIHPAEAGTGDVMLYPNPFNQNTTFAYRKNTSYQGVLKLVLYDMTGHIIRQESHEGASFILDRGDLAPGLYFYELRDNEDRIYHGKVEVN
jgi:hypothetical protein